MFNKTASAARDVFDVRRLALVGLAQRLRLIRTRKVRSPLDKRSLRLTIYAWGRFDISSGCGQAMSTLPVFAPLLKRLDSRTEKSYVAWF